MSYSSLSFNPVGGGHTTIIASPANLNISPPLFDIDLINNSIYLLIANAMTSDPSGPILESYSVKLVNPQISANMITLLNDCISGTYGFIPFIWFSRIC